MSMATIDHLYNKNIIINNFKDFEVLVSIDMFIHGTSITCVIQQEEHGIPN